MMESRPMPPASQLIQQGFQHWRVHQRAFWLLAGLSAIGIVVLKMVTPGGSSAVVAGLYIFIFDQWMKLALFPDWKQREPALRKSKEGRRLSGSQRHSGVAHGAGDVGHADHAGWASADIPQHPFSAARISSPCSRFPGPRGIAGFVCALSRRLWHRTSFHREDRLAAGASSRSLTE